MTTNTREPNYCPYCKQPTESEHHCDPPKRRRYNPSGALSEYGIIPECDAQSPADARPSRAISEILRGVGRDRRNLTRARRGRGRVSNE